MEMLLALFVLAAIYILEEQRMREVASWLQDFLTYLERQQG